jgi:hypothetical protein
MLCIALWVGKNFLIAAQAASKQPKRYAKYQPKVF